MSHSIGQALAKCESLDPVWGRVRVPCELAMTRLKFLETFPPTEIRTTVSGTGELVYFKSDTIMIGGGATPLPAVRPQELAGSFAITLEVARSQREPVVEDGVAHIRITGPLPGLSPRIYLCIDCPRFELSEEFDFPAETVPIETSHPVTIALGEPFRRAG